MKAKELFLDIETQNLISNFLRLALGEDARFILLLGEEGGKDISVISDCKDLSFIVKKLRKTADTIEKENIILL